MAKKVIMFGPPSVGKGYVLNHLEKSRIPVYPIGTGDLIREKLRTDPDFSSKFKPVVERGELIDDSTILDMVQKEWRSASVHSKLIYLDGVPRSEKQLKYLVDKCLITREDTVVFPMTASYEVCRRRLDERLEREKKKGLVRDDAAAFDKRYDVHMKSVPGFLNLCASMGLIQVPIDANMDLNNVAKIILSLAHTHYYGPNRQAARPVTIMTSRQRVWAANLASSSRVT